MSEEKFISEVQTVLKFVQIYCHDKHRTPQKPNYLHVEYKDKKLLHVNFTLCATCKETFFYSVQRLQECPHEQKPRCRKCTKPCYEREKWKEMTKIMRYSGMKLGVLKIKSFFKKD